MATLDVITLAEAKTAISMSANNDDHDTKLGQHITAVSGIMDSLCGPIVQRTITAELHDDPGDAVTLRYSPVTSIGTVREAVPGEITTLTAGTFGAVADGYRAEQDWRGGTLYSGVLYRLWGGYVGAWVCGAQVEVTYTAGRFADTASVDARFKDCAGAIMRRLWKREAGSWAQSSTFYESLGGGDETPAGSGFFKVAEPIVRELLGDETRLPGHA